VGLRQVSQDRLGSVRDVWDGSGVALDHVEYAAYGAISSETASALGGHYLYTGLTENRTTNTATAYWRTVFVDIGRWLQPDPITFSAGDGNIGRYVGNNPTNATDPTGLALEVAGKTVDAGSDVYKLLSKTSDTAKEVLNLMIEGMGKSGSFQFDSQEELQIQLQYRTAAVDAAKQLAKSEIDFTYDTARLVDAEKSKYWENAPDFYKNGDEKSKKKYLDAIKLKKGATASEGFAEIFQHPENFTFDCASAVSVALWSAKLQVLKQNPERAAQFDESSKGEIFIGGWKAPRADLVAGKNDGKILLPGDAVPFRNPLGKDAAFRTENSLFLGADQFFVLGFSDKRILTEKQIVRELNRLRVDGATEKDTAKLDLSSKFSWVHPFVGSEKPK
jgi:RHS repeat-associated protein